MHRKKPQSVLGPLVFVVILLLLPVCATGTTMILNIRHWSAPDHTRLVIDAGAELQYTEVKSDRRVDLTFADVSLPRDFPTELSLRKPGIERVTISPPSQGIVNVRLWLAPPVNVNVFKLKKFQDKPHRVVIDIGLPEVEKKESEERQQVKTSKKDKIVIIDPGHGGDDPGAVGKGGTYEKAVVLDIGRRIRDILNGAGGFRAFLTRNDDYYVPFKKRLMIARDYGADLFLSVHADAAQNRSAHGSSVYCLSSGGASSEAARLLARKENLADIIGGSLEEEHGNDESAPIILNMFQTRTINQSKQFGGKFLRHLDEIGDLKFATVLGAPFRVLKLPDIPSLLVETAYISNPIEERQLRNGDFRGEMAGAMALAAGECLSVSPVTMKAIRAQIASSTKAVSQYRVRKGDTLSNIARRHDTAVNVILKLNNMKLQDTLYPGRVLKMRADELYGKKPDAEITHGDRDGAPSADGSNGCIYRVRKGDTLAAIAQKCGTTIGALLTVNRMRRSDTLYTDQLLKVPRDPSM